MKMWNISCPENRVVDIRICFFFPQKIIIWIVKSFISFVQFRIVFKSKFCKMWPFKTSLSYFFSICFLIHYLYVQEQLIWENGKKQNNKKTFVKTKENQVSVKYNWKKEKKTNFLGESIKPTGISNIIDKDRKGKTRQNKL